MVGLFARFGEDLERSALLVTASTAAASFDGHELAGLHGSEADQGTDAFIQARANLKRIRAAIPLSRFAYLMAYRESELVFLADAEPSYSLDYSPPGEPYTEASPVLHGVFATARAATEGPISDRWGNWVSGLAPVVDATTGQVVAVFGVDISAERWQANVAGFRWLGYAVGGLLLGIVLFFSYLVFRQYRLAAKLEGAGHVAEEAQAIARVGTWNLDVVSGELNWSLEHFRIFGFDPETFKPSFEAVVARIHPDDRASFEQAYAQSVANHGVYEFDKRIVLDDGSIKFIHGSGRTFYNADGDPVRSVGTVQDVTERKLVEERIVFTNTLLKTQLETSPDAILVVDENGRITSFNQRFAEMWQIQTELIDEGNDAPVLAAVAGAAKDQVKFLARVQHLYRHPEEAGHDEVETTDGRFIDRHTAPLRSDTGRYLGRIWFFRDITARKLADAQILRMARYDGLTGLANRTVFMERVRQAIARAKRGGKGFAVLYLDLDHFKDVNDTLGHPVGDELLKSVAARLLSHAREIDTVARFGGDEFAVVVADIGEPADAAILADTLIKALGDPFSIGGSEIRTGASVGISVYGADQPDAETLMSQADVALYRAKGEGRGDYRFFTDAMDTEVQTRVTVSGELRQAIAGGQLFLVYQPQVEMETGRITGVEALVRWRHPERGVLGPGEFVSVAEKSGLILGLGHWVLLEACRRAKAWLDAGIAPGRVAVNLSGVQFKRPIELEKDITAVLAETGFPPDMLELELTETVLMEASLEHNDVLLRLRRSGITLAIDDFGTGYSSLDYLRRFPADRIKIAQNFVGRITTVPGNAAIVKATIGLARELGMMVIAEGVDSDEQLSLLRGWGCRDAQGFYFSEPLDRVDIEPLLRRGKILRPDAARARTAA
jgi:diguanylate cyclase (GGDEF)-like protein/PAS domain S-box-containing protein